MTKATTNDVRPGKAWIWVGAGLMALAAVAFVVLLVSGLVRLFGELDQYERVQPNSSSTLYLDEGTYLVFSDGVDQAMPTVVGETGAVNLTRPSGNTTYSADGATWTATYGFEVDEPGDYDITNEGTGRIAVGPPIVGSILAVVLVPLGVGFFLGATGLVVLITTLVKRSKAKRQLAGTLQPQA